jgi:hypothetical protein
MAEVTITVCDECRHPARKIERYVLNDGRRSVTIVLCAEHDAPIRKFFALTDSPAMPDGEQPAVVPAQPATEAARKPGGGRMITVIDPDKIPRRR